MTAVTGNVLHVVDSLGLGGVQTILKDYFESRRDDRSIHLFGLRTVAKEIAIDHPNVGVHASPARFSPAPLGAMRRIVRERAIGVLHCHLFRSQVFGFLMKALFFPRIALVFHEHGRAVGQEEGGLEAWVFRAFLRVAHPWVGRFVCISEHTRSCLLRIIPAAAPRATVVVNPIPIHPRGGGVDREAIRRAEAIPPGAFVVGFGSRLVARKGWNDFLEAMAVVAPGLSIYFVVAGDGEDRAKAEARIAELGLREHGRMLGHVDSMPRFYACLDCLVMPSHWEPHGLAHLEAQSFGVPVIVSDVPGLRSTVHAEDDALLVPPHDPAAIAAGVQRLAGDPQLRGRLVAGGLANSALYSMGAFTRGLDEVYASLATARAERREAA